MHRADQAKLEYWFSDLDKKIDDYDLEIHVAEIQLRAFKDGIDPNSPKVSAVIREFVAAVKEHNKPFVLLEQQNDLLAKHKNQLAILDGKRPAKSSSQRRLVEKATKLGQDIVRQEVVDRIAQLEAERSQNPAFLLKQSQAEQAPHPQLTPIPDKAGWVRIECAGGCGRHVEIRRKSVASATFYVCNSRASGCKCKASLPPALPGQICSMEFNAAAHFMGITYKWPTPSQAASMARAQGILAAGLTQLAMEKAGREET